MVKGDGEGYHAYLAAYVVDRDPSFRTLVGRRFPTADSVRLAGLTYQEATGRYLDKYPAGQALATLPFFAAGHGIAVLRGEPADGYSRSEQVLSGLAAVVWAAAGLLALRRLLLGRFPDPVVAATLVCLALGTSLFHYLTYDASYSHAFSFGAVCIAWLAIGRWLERPASALRALQAGAATGLVVSLRPANALVVAPVVLFGVVSRRSLRARVETLRRHWRPLLAAVAGATPAVAATLGAWALAAGRPVLFSYPSGERFAFADPSWQVLYSFRPHGLLPYAPVLALALVGLVQLWRSGREWFWPVLLALCIQTYLLASWRAWHLGDGFGHRGYVDVLVAFALPLAAVLAAAWRTRWRCAVGAVAATLTVTTVLGTLAYWQDRLPADGAAPRDYGRALLGHDAEASSPAP